MSEELPEGITGGEGGWYEVAGQKVQGLEAAVALLEKQENGEEPTELEALLQEMGKRGLGMPRAIRIKDEEAQLAFCRACINANDAALSDDDAEAADDGAESEPGGSEEE